MDIKNLKIKSDVKIVIPEKLIPAILISIDWQEGEDCLGEDCKELIKMIYDQCKDEELKKIIIDRYSWFLNSLEKQS